MAKNIMTNVTIAEAIKQLRVQLEDAQHEGKGKDLRFLAKNVEVELGVVFKTEAEGIAGVKGWFLDISGKAKTGDETAHKVKLVLEPVGRDSKPTMVGDTEHEKE
ncbi:MAG: trypco2 family protein [Methylocella sp.]